MEAIENNWYIILDLEYYPNPVENERKIKERIEEKREEWEIKTLTDIINAQIYKRYLSLEKKGKIVSEMLNENRRKELIEDAQRKLFEPIDKVLSQIDVEITEKKVEQIAKMLNRDENLIRERLKKFGKKVERAKYNKTFYEDFCNFLKGKHYYYLGEQIEEELKVLGMSGKNIYDFLKAEGLSLIDKKEEREADKSKIEKRRNILKSKHNDESSAKSKLFMMYEEILKDTEKKKEYDNFLRRRQYLKINNVLRDIKKIYELNEKNKLTEMQVKKDIKEIEDILKNKRAEAEGIFYGFGDAEQISYEDVGTDNSSKNSQNKNNGRNWGKPYNATENSQDKKKNSSNENQEKNYNKNNSSTEIKTEMDVKDAKILFWVSGIYLFF